jgi:hypothetical protein
MKRSSRTVSRSLLIVALSGVAVLGGCSETATTAPTRPSPQAVTAHDDGPPLAPCSSGWIMISGVWVCEG